HRIAAEDDHADVGYAFVGVIGETLVEVDQRLDDGDIARAAQRIQHGEDVGDVAFDVFASDACTAGLDVAVAVAALDHEDALAAAPLGRLDDEAGATGDHLDHVAHRELRAHRTDQLR